MDRERSLRSVPKGEDYLDPEWSRPGARHRLAARQRCATKDSKVRRSRTPFGGSSGELGSAG